MNEKVEKAVAEHHYYATCVFGWATADTRDEAIEKLVGRLRSDMKRVVSVAHKNGDPGAYVWSCKVNAPSDAPYKINFFAPQGVDICDAKEHAITYVTKKKIAYGDWSRPPKRESA